MRAVAYSEEGDTLLAFTFTARTKAAYDANFPVFVGLIQKYRAGNSVVACGNGAADNLARVQKNQRQTPILGEEA